jgi:hypothetical protein
LDLCEPLSPGQFPLLKRIVLWDSELCIGWYIIEDVVGVTPCWFEFILEQEKYKSGYGFGRSPISISRRAVSALHIEKNRVFRGKSTAIHL